MGQKRNKNVVQYNQEELIAIISDNTGIFKTEVKALLGIIEQTLVDLISDATEEQAVEVKVGKGLYLGAKFWKGRKAADPRTLEPIVTEDKLRPYMRIGEGFKDEVNKAYKDKLEERMIYEELSI